MANYRKTYFCICDGQQETMYLDHIARLPEDGKKIGDTICYNNPDFSINEFLKMVMIDCGDL